MLDVLDTNIHNNKIIVSGKHRLALAYIMDNEKVALFEPNGKMDRMVKQLFDSMESAIDFLTNPDTLVIETEPENGDLFEGFKLNGR